MKINHIFHKRKQNLSIQEYAMAKFKPFLIVGGGIILILAASAIGFFVSGILGIIMFLMGMGLAGYGALLQEHTQWNRGIE